MTRPDTVTERRPVHPAIGLLVSIAIVAVVAALGSLATVPNVDGWYADAQKPSWTPPNWVFGPVWTVLYLAMAVAAWLVWRRRAERDVSGALVVYGQQLLFNALWTPAFFALYPVLSTGALWLALLIIVALFAFVAVAIRRFWRISRPAAALLVPYLLWVGYAASLNAGVAFLAI